MPLLGKGPCKWNPRAHQLLLGWPIPRAVVLLPVDQTQSSETGTVQGLWGHNLPRQRKVRIGKTGRSRAVRDQWALLPTEGEGSRKGQGKW